MRTETLNLFREIVKNRPEQIRNKVLGFDFSAKIFPNWGEVTKKQKDYINSLGGNITDADVLNPKYVWGVFTGSFDYTLFINDNAGGYANVSLEKQPYFGPDQEVGEFTKSYSDLILSSIRSTDTSIKHFFGAGDLGINFSFLNEEWHKNLPENLRKGETQENLWPNRVNCLYWQNSLQVTPNLFVPLHLEESLSYISEALIITNPSLDKLPDYFSINKDYLYAPKPIQGLRLPTDVDWRFKYDFWGAKNFYTLSHQFCEVHLEVYPKVLRYGIWPDIY